MTGSPRFDPLAIPAVVGARARAEGSADWLDSLAEAVTELGELWELTYRETFADSTEAVVVAVDTPHGPAVLKLLIPRRGEADSTNEAAVLAHANGAGCAALLKYSPTHHALLIERLGPSLHSLGLPIGMRHEVLCAAAERLWRPAPNLGLPTGTRKADYLIAEITRLWEELDRPCSAHAVSYSIECAERRGAAHDDERAVLVHGDVHEWNALQAGDGFKLIDPDGLHAEAEYDLGIIMREDPIELMVGDPMDRARWLAARCDKDVTSIWEWGVVERVSTGLLATSIGLQPVGAQMLEAAERCATMYD